MSVGRCTICGSCVALVVAFALAFGGAGPFAGGWNDGSRLAAVEAIADFGTLAIDDSIFVHPDKAAIPPYTIDNPSLLREGTKDKLWVDGQFYSDKPPVVSFIIAGVYRCCQHMGLPPAAERPDLFCRWMTLATSLFAFVVTLLCMFRLASLIGLDLGGQLLLVASLALSTVALTYTRHVNNHILLLGVIAALLLQMVRLASEHRKAGANWLRIALVGNLAGVAFNLDLGAGPVLHFCVAAWVWIRCRSGVALAFALLASAPWIAAHYCFNFGIGGVWTPINTVPEYMSWPGSPFNESNLTGFWRHGPVKLVVYSLALLFGKHGFFGHNLPLFLALFAVVKLWRRGVPQSPELLFGVVWCLGTWLMYAGFSTNYGGACCSVRWFVPFLAPAYFALAVFLVEFPEYRGDFVILSLWGGLLGLIMWAQGPWTARMTPWFWQIHASALTTWGLWRYRQRHIHSHRTTAFSTRHTEVAAAA